MLPLLLKYDFPGSAGAGHGMPLPPVLLEFLAARLSSCSAPFDSIAQAEPSQAFIGRSRGVAAPDGQYIGTLYETCTNRRGGGNVCDQIIKTGNRNRIVR
jgi:hypothetical protein